MSADPFYLEVEMILLVDEITHSIQKMLQIENFDGPPGLTIDEYSIEPDAVLEIPGELPDDIPFMGEASVLYSKKVRYAYRPCDEEERKF